MKVAIANLQNNVVSSYDQTKTTVQGRAVQKVIDGKTVIGPPINTFVDTVADSAGLTVPVLSCLTQNGRLFSLGAEVGGGMFMSLHEVDMTTGSKTFVGNIRISIADVAATTHTLRALKVIDTGTTGWKIFIATSASVLINGGLYCANNIDKADFIPVGSTLIPFATGLNAKAVYFLQDPSNIGVGQLNVAAVGAALDTANNKIYVHNGVSATHQYYVYNTNSSLDCPLSTGLVVDSATDRITHTAHGYVDNTPIYLTALTGGAGLTTNTVYFVRNSTANDYQLSATTGGAAINITTNGTVDVCRAFGTTGSAFAFKTGNLPALTGTLLSSDCEDYALPQHTSNSGFSCIFFATGSSLYLGKLSELTAGAVTWPSLITSNLLGSSNQITTPTATSATWSNALDKAIYITNGTIFVMKPFANNSVDYIFGGLNNKYRETFSTSVVELGLITITSLDVESGWLTVTGSTVGQRGNILCDLRSDCLFDYSYFITPVLDTPSAVYKFIATTDALFDYTGSLDIYYRTSGFGSISGGWTSIPFAEMLDSYAAGAQVQFKVCFATLGLDTCIPAQIQEFYLGYSSLSEISDNWEFSDDYSDNNTPSRVAFRLKKSYATTVPVLYFRAHDLSDSLLINNNTASNPLNFEYSTDGGTSWLALGTIPNTVGTLVRYTFTSPPGVNIRPSIREA